MSADRNAEGEGSSRVPGSSTRNRTRTGGLSRMKPIIRGDGNGSPGLRMFAVRQLLPRLDALSKEIEGVRAGEDIEYLHRMRVASRRLRAALPVFKSCFPPGKYGRWLSDIRRITRVLGDARDADVQVASLKKYRKQLVKKYETNPDGKKPEDDALMEGIGYLLSRTRDRRAAYQKEIVSALSDLGKHHVIEEIRQEVLAGAVPYALVQKNSLMAGVTTAGVSHIGKGIDKMLSYDHWVQYPDAVAEHHAMRIAAKQLRYMMELYSPLYRRGLKKQISQIAGLQEILGDLHDCDVWIDMVTYLLLKERTKPRVLRDQNRPGPVIIAGLRQFTKDREKERKSIYRRFFRRWESLSRSGMWQALRSILVTGVRVPFSIPENFPDDVTVQAVRDLADIYPPGISHADHVDKLARDLFDSLLLVHGLDMRSRLLLESAALLHDIGGVGGQKGHPARSARMILSDDYLPFGIPERCIIALAAESHRKKGRIRSEGIFNVLSLPDQQRALWITALLRMADGLDFRNTGAVSSVGCKTSGKQVLCTVSSGVESGPEQQKFLARSDLFTRVSGLSVGFGLQQQ